VERRPPPKWGEDELTGFFNAERQNQFATFVHHPLAETLIEIDSIQLRALQGWVNPRPFFAPQFFVRAHSSYRGAAASAFAGRVAEVFPLCRVALEYAAYGFHIGKSKDRYEVWLRRSDSEECKKEMKSAFRIPRLRESLKARDQGLDSVFWDLYERTIEYGAHPNLQGVVINIQQDKTDDGASQRIIYAHEAGPQLDISMSTVALVGLFSLRAFRLLHSTRCELLGVSDRISRLEGRF